MITNLAELFQTILIALIMTLSLSPVMIWASKRYGLVDRPGSAEHKQHAAATPVAGGLVFGVALGAGILIAPFEWSLPIKGILSSTYLLIVIGLIDDAINLKPLYKLVGQIFAATLVVLSGVQVHVTLVNWIDLLITFVWLVGITNAFNFVDSMDGLAVGLGGIISAYFMLVTIDASQPDYAILSAIVLGIMIGAFLYTSPPARMFLGDSGSQSIGIVLASIGVAYTPGQAGLPQGSTWFIPILALIVPIFDMVVVVSSRIRRGKPVYRADNDHIFHRLVALGIHPSRAVATMHVSSILAGLVAFIALGMTVIAANLIFGCVLLLGIGLLIFLERQYMLQGKQVDKQ